MCPECVCVPDLHVEPQPGSSLSTQELMTRLCFLLGEATPSTASSPMEDRREKKVGQHIDLLAVWMVYKTIIFSYHPKYLFFFNHLNTTHWRLIDLILNLTVCKAVLCWILYVTLIPPRKTDQYKSQNIINYVAILLHGPISIISGLLV